MKNVQKVRENPSDRELSPRQVADAIGVSVSSLKRWCDRGDIPTSKTVGGHRRISRGAVVRFLRDRGFDPKRPDLLGLPAGARLESRDADEVLPQLIEALIAGDEHRLVSLLAGLFLAKRSIANIGDQFVAPAFAVIGERWANNDLHIYEEHRAVAIMRAGLERLRRFLPDPPADAPLALSATLSGDPYLLPIALIELSMREIGWNAAVLGPNHPVESLGAALRDIRPRLLCLNVSYNPGPIELVNAVGRVHALATDLGIALAIGGARLDEDLRQRLSCTAHCRTMGDLVSLARGLEPDAMERLPAAE